MSEVVDVLLRARGEFSDLTGKISNLRKDFQKLKLPKDITENLEKSFNRLDPILKNYQKQLDKGFKSKTDLKNFEATRNELNAIFNDIGSEIQKINGKPIQLKADLKEITALEKKLDGFTAKLQKALDSISIDKGKQVTNDINRIVDATKKASTIKPMTIKAQELFNQQDFVAFNNEIDKIQNKILSLSNKSGAKIDLARSLGFKGSTFTKEGQEITEQVDKVNDLITRFFASLKVSDHALGGLEKANRDITQTGEALSKVKTDSLSRGAQAAEEFGRGVNKASQGARDLGASIGGVASSSVRMTEELNQLKTSTQYFFSLRNMINLFKRGVREAVGVIKELDAAMTETAVVTKYSVGDMWKKLPEYTTNANALGATVKDMYKATTLYYQQGLNTEQAMGIANETMKMARIGGLEAADATDKMTAALRGFNMEINETSAQRINDVYSNLAAKTASNTEELGTAMQRTASIAHSAGMSFEGTAAFLAQAIETTREPAENLGTAMKTIVARFQELKKNPLEITEVEGEEVSYNKVDAALQSIGVSLKDANGQFRDLDKVFLDISRKWDGLTQTQQRYIATTAAGSRQQSRFIAMMSNYDRTMELMSYANDSAGASNEQFGKTMESLEAKINKFKNAWNEFLMSIMNDSMTKFVVDTGTKLLNLLDGITNFLSFGGKSGLLKSITSLTAAFIGLKTAGRLINFGVNRAGSFLDPTTKRGALGLGEVGGAKGIAGRITTPIVAKLNELIAVTKGQKTLDKSVVSSLAAYKNATNLLRMPQTVGTMRSTLGQLSDDHAYAAYVNSPGTASAMKRTAMEWLNTQNLSPEMRETGTQLMSSILKGMQKKQIPIKKGAELIGKPQLWGKYLGTETAQSFSDNFIKIQKAQQTKQAAAAMREAWRKAGGDSSATDEEIKSSLKGKYKTDFKDRVTRYYKQIRQEQKAAESLDQKAINHKSYEQLANSVGILGSKFTAAGYSMQMFGAQLGQLSPALQGIGTLLSQIGIAVSTFGMGISGIGTVATKVIGRVSTAATAAKAASAAGLTAKTTANVFLGTLTEGLSAGAIGGILGVALVGGFLIAKNLIEKKAKEAGEEVRENFEKGFTETNKKIDSLEGYKDRFDELSKGVDQFGHNVSLTSEEYDEYLSISRELQELSPSLIAGYNAEGEAIIKKGDAIQGVIDKLKEEKQAELDLFTSNTSINKLIGEYKTSDAYKNYRRTTTGKDDKIVEAFNAERSKIASLDDSDLKFKLTDSINQLTGWNLSSLDNLTTGQLSWLSKHYNDVINLVEEHNGKLEDEVKEGYVDAFTGASSAIEEVMTEGKPIIDAMQMWMGTEHLDAIGIGLGEEFGDSFNQGFEGIMLAGLSRGWSADQFKTGLRDYSNEWKKLAGSTSDYADIMKEAKDIQEEYLDDMGSDNAVENYNANITESCEKLIELANNTDTATAAGQAFQQQCIAQANALRNYATSGGMALSEALNTATDDIQRAEAALNEFNEATKTDLYTAAEGMKSIYDKAFETYKDSFGGEYEKHFEGKGDHTAWEAGRSILGEEALKSIPDGQALRKKLKEWEPALREGEEGWYNFWTKITGDSKLMENLNKIDGVHWDENDFYIPDDKWAEVAKTIGISEEMLTSMLNKGRQFANIDFTNWKEARHTFETSNVGIEGTASTANEGGQRKLFIKEETFEAALADANYKPEEYEGKKEDARTQQNFEFLKAANEYNNKELRNLFTKEMGINNLQDLIATLIQTNDYTKDEIKDYAEKAGFEGDFEGLYAELAEAMENPELAKQTSVLETISSQIAALADTRTGEKAKEDYDEAHKELVGGTGVDTDAQAFAYGKKLVRDENGNIVYDKNGKAKLEDLTAGEFEQTKISMQAVADNFKQTAAIAAEKVKTTSGAEQDYWKEVQAGAEADAARAEKYVQMADEAMQKRAETEQQEVEGRAQETKARNEARKAEQEAAKAAAEENNKAAQAKGQAQTEYENNKPVTEAEGKAARDEAKIKQEQQQRQKALEEENKKRWEEEDKRAQAQTAADKKAEEEKANTRKALQKQTEAEGQKLKQRYEAEEQARKRKNIEEQNQLEGAKLAERAKQEQEAQRKAQLESQDQGRSQGRALSTEQTIAQAEDIQGKTDYLLRTSIDTSLKNALDGLDPTEIAADSAKSQAFSNLYKDLINNTLPEAKDLQTLGIFNQLGSQYQDEILGGIEEKSSVLGEKFSAAYQAFAEADKAALAMDVVPTNDNIEKAIDSVGERLRNWWNRINGIETGSNSQPSSPQQTIERAQTSGQARTEQLKAVFTSEGAEKVQEEEDTIKEKADKGATHITKFETENEGAVKKATDSGSETKTVKVKADTSSVDKAGSAPVTKTINLDDKATPKIKQIDAAGKKPVTKVINISPNTIGTWQKTFTVVERKVPGGYTGLSNKISFHHVPEAGSLARGTKKGRTGPRNQGGLTLTGELGYEVAWFPKENKSAILGANGPQMVNLPKDAVIYNHEQSKEILKRKSIPAGSQADARGSYDASSSRYASGGGGGGGGGRGAGKKDDTSKAIKKSAEEAAQAVKKVSVWWENIARKTEAVQRAASKNQKQLEKYLKSMNATLAGAAENGGDASIEKLNDTIAYYESQLTRAGKELEALAKGAGGSQKSMKKHYGQTGYENIAQISYKSGKSNKTKFVNLAKYIKVDPTTGAYIVDQAALNKVSNKDERQAIADAANKEINDRISKLNKADDEIEKAQEEIEKIGEQLYETFYAWETSLTKIWNITQKIEDTLNKIDRSEGMLGLVDAQIASGLRQADETSAQEGLELFRQKLLQQNEVVTERQKAIKQAKDDLIRALSYEDEERELQSVRAAIASGTLSLSQIETYKQREKALMDEIEAIKRASEEFMTITQMADGTIKIDFDADKLQEAKESGSVSKDLADRIEKYVNDLIEKSGNIDDLYKSVADDLTQQYNALTELKDQWVDYEKQLIQMTDESNKKRIDQMKQLSDVVKKSLDDLLKNVKKKLDERRRAEDNAKTESDILAKQRRLAMLRADTSGGHQVEIAQLEKEIAEAQQNYERTLEDQLLEKLQTQADEAAEQRERQIELQENILSSVDNIALVQELMANPAANRERLLELYKENNNFDAVGPEEQQQILDHFETFYQGLLTNQEQQEELTNAIEASTDVLKMLVAAQKGSNIEIKDLKEQGVTASDAHDLYGIDYKDLIDIGGYGAADFKASNISYETAKEYFDLKTLRSAGYEEADQEIQRIAEEERAAKEIQERQEAQQRAEEEERYRRLVQAVTHYPNEGSVARLLQVGHQIGKNSKEIGQEIGLTGSGSLLDETGSLINFMSRPFNLGRTDFLEQFDLTRKDILDFSHGVSSGYAEYIKKRAERQQEGFRLPRYASGGLNASTGPAWLDGTPSKPELVLNAKDTENFLALRDILSKAISSASSIDNSYTGDNIFEININVDKIEKDYDVDQVVERVKKKIVGSSSYRNVTQVRNFR